MNTQSNFLRLRQSLVIIQTGFLSLYLIGIAKAQERPEELLSIRVGTLPIVISAPHGGRLAIRDAPVRKVLMQRGCRRHRPSSTTCSTA